MQKTILITSPDGAEESNLVNAMFDEGLELLYLRKPDWTAKQYEFFLSKISAIYLNKIMIHINAPMQDDSQLWGRHWGYDLFKRSLKDGKAKCKSISVHSFEEYQEIYDYADQIFISPFFDSISKKGYTQNKALWNINENVKLDKAVALGGINASNCLELRKIGISRFAVLGAVWNNENPLSSFLEIQNMVK